MRNFIKCNLVNDLFLHLWYNRILSLILLPLSWLYGLITWLIRLSYRLGFRRIWRAPVPVVIVGNLTSGGNGKTPVVIWLVEQLTKHGIVVGVVSRGYGGKANFYPLLINEHTSITEAGDEPVLIFQRTGVPVAVSPKRSEAIKILLKKYPIQIIIADDGLQHYALARDKEIVVIDGIRRFGNGHLLPAGPMRESVTRLCSVDTIIINGGKTKKGEISMSLRPGQAVNLLTGKQCELTKLHHLVAIAGIGYPMRFFTMIESFGISLEKQIALADHQILSLEQINSILLPYQSLIMTEKDAVKYRLFAKDNWWYLPVHTELNINESKLLLRQLISLIHPIFSSIC